MNEMCQELQRVLQWLLNQGFVKREDRGNGGIYEKDNLQIMFVKQYADDINTIEGVVIYNGTVMQLVTQNFIDTDFEVNIVSVIKQYMEPVPASVEAAEIINNG